MCYPVAVSVDNILGTRSSNDFGIDIGGGVTFGSRSEILRRDALPLCVGADHHAPANLPAGTVNLRERLQLERLVLPDHVRSQVVTTRDRAPR